MIRHQPSRIALAGAGIVLCVAVFFSVDASVPPRPVAASERSTQVDLEKQNAELAQRADRLFSQGKWSGARSAYDQVLARTVNWLSPEARLAAERGAACALKLRAFDDAFRRATALREKTELPETENRFWPQPGSTEFHTELKTRLAEIANLESVRRLWGELARELPIAGNEQFRRKVLTARLAIDFQLLGLLDPDAVPEPTNWGWSTRYPEMQWWVNDLKGRGDSEAEEAEESWMQRESIPLNAESQPVFLRAPAQFEPGLSRSAKVLFLLGEVERLDASPQRDDVALALLHRADIARRLYGPQEDEHWRAADFEYRMRDRPWFRKPRAPRNLKEDWQLEDNEVRTLFGGRLRVAALPPSECPLTIWSRIENECPNSKAVPEAIYQRGLYYQNRRQFSKASAEYGRLIARFPKHPRAQTARKQIALIEHADVLLGNTGVSLSGSQPKLWFACRNADKAEFIARRFDLKGYFENRVMAGAWWQIAYLNADPFFFREKMQSEDAVLRAKFMGPEVARWNERVPRTERVATHTTRAPLSQIGTYVVEARVPGGPEPSSALVIVTEAAVVQKSLPGKLLLWAVNSRTGQPLARQKVEIYSDVSTDSERPSCRTSSHSSDERGVIEIVPPRHRQSFALLVTQQNGIALCALKDAGYSEGGGKEGHVFGVTDRPVYRPGSKVQFRVWVRELADRQYQPAKAGVKLRILVQGQSERSQEMSLERVTDESGSAAGSVALGKEATLGEYSITVDGFGSSRWDAACKFTVEEYKKPEFEVTVTPPKAPPRLGGLITARVTARYYFGAPVAGGRLTYQVTRRAHRTRYAVPREWDWLYGNGFGDYEYSYPWLDGGDMQEEGTTDASNDDSGPVHDEMVAAGTVRLNAEGWADLHIDTTKDPRETDQQYSIEATVRDESRRTIEATGRVVAVRQPCYAFAELDGGWYEPGRPAAVEISTRSVVDAPVDIEGTLTLFRIGESPGKVERKTVGAWKVRTGAAGHFRFPFRAGIEGQYRFEFAARDAGGQPVQAAANFWVHGPKFDPRRQRVGSLEIIPDRRWYQPGETARVLIHTAQSDARLLMWDSFNHFWFLDVTGGARVLEIPILARHVPNYFIEATLVAEGRVHTEKCELFVPPVHDVVKIELRSDRAAYSPGQKGRVRIHATDVSGRPVRGTMTLTAYDKSLTYFQGEESEGPRLLLLARIDHFWSSGVTSTLSSRQFGVLGSFVCPEFHLDDAARPPTGAMGGSAGVPSDPSEGHRKETTAQRRSKDGKNEESPRPRLLPEPRRNFADTAAWLPNLALDQNGMADAEIAYPDSTTTWRLRGDLVTKETHVGEAAAQVTTTKPFLVRLQAPRFAVEHDEVTLSANVHNDLNSKKDVTAVLIVPAALFESLAKSSEPIVPDKEGNLRLTAQAAIGPHDEHRFDWPLKARTDGLAAVTVQAACDEAGDAMHLEFPIRPRGALESVSQAGIATAENTQEQSFTFELPPAIDPSKTQIDVSLSPSACGSIFDAVPFLAGYPYGCVEQTMSRFYPTVVAVDTLRKLGVDLKALAEHAQKSARPRWARFGPSPVFDRAELNRMTGAGLDRLYEFQHEDGGWGWWEHDDSTPYMTAYVLFGLDTAAGAGVKIDDSIYRRGLDYLHRSLRRAGDRKRGVENGEERALICYVLSLPRSKLTKKLDPGMFFVEEHLHTLDKMFGAVYAERGKLNNYGRALLALALEHRKESKKAQTVLDEILSAIQVDKKHALASIPTSRSGWWHWYNGEIETNAWVLRALVAIDAKNPLTAELANWLAANRRHGSYWQSTRDTALAVQALAEYMRIAGENTAEFTVGIGLDGRQVAEARVGWNKSLLTGSRLALDGKALEPGRHRVTLTKQQRGPLYYSITANYFDRSERIPASGSGIHIVRRYYRRSAPTAAAAGTQGQAARPAVHARTPLIDGDTLKIGDMVEVELAISSDENYDYLAFEDPKPAGFEPVQLQSGYGWGDGLCANVELRDENVVFFSDEVLRGRHMLRYRLRAEVPGSFQARPAHAFDMYNPEIQAQSAATRLNVRD